MHHYRFSILSCLAFVTVLISCGSSSKEENISNDESDETPSFVKPFSVIELTEEQSDAFDALNSLQVSTQGHLYSTFVNSINQFTTPDTSFTLTQSKFKKALLVITNRHGDELSQAEYDTLVEASIYADDKYYVEYFRIDPTLETDVTHLSGPPTNGKWIIRGVLNRRDIILDWQEPSGLIRF